MQYQRYSQAGNSFVIIDGDVPANITKTCGGDDGVIVVSPSDIADVAILIFNRDGSRASMCGNGICCAMAYCYDNGLCTENAAIETDRGVMHLSYDEGVVTTTLPMPSKAENVAITLDDGTEYSGIFINTGVPHYVITVDDIENIDVETIGKEIRYHEAFAPKGANVDFVLYKDGMIYIRTYETGVEAETLACGTGSAAAALSLGIASPVTVKTRSGETLTITIGTTLTLSGSPKNITN